MHLKKLLKKVRFWEDPGEEKKGLPPGQTIESIKKEPKGSLLHRLLRPSESLDRPSTGQSKQELKLPPAWRMKQVRVDAGQGEALAWANRPRALTNHIPKGWKSRPLKVQESLWKDRTVVK